MSRNLNSWPFHYSLITSWHMKSVLECNKLTGVSAKLLSYGKKEFITARWHGAACAICYVWVAEYKNITLLEWHFAGTLGKHFVVEFLGSHPWYETKLPLGISQLTTSTKQVNNGRVSLSNFKPLLICAHVTSAELVGIQL